MGNCIGAKTQGSRGSNNILKSTQKQGAKELKANYQIDNNTKILGTGAFGKVFLTHNKNLKDF